MTFNFRSDQNESWGETFTIDQSNWFEQKVIEVSNIILQANMCCADLWYLYYSFLQWCHYCLLCSTWVISLYSISGARYRMLIISIGSMCCQSTAKCLIGKRSEWSFDCSHLVVLSVVEVIIVIFSVWSCHLTGVLYRLQWRVLVRLWCSWRQLQITSTDSSWDPLQVTQPSHWAVIMTISLLEDSIIPW